MVKSKQKVIIFSSAAALVIAAAIIVFVCINKSKGGDGIAYVSPVSELNTAVIQVSGNKYSGVVESQKTYDIKQDMDKTIKEVLVSDGDSVEEGAELFVYDIEEMQLELENGEIEIERMENEIDSNEDQISELESEKKNVSSNNQVSYTTQIQSLKTDIEKIKYDIKVKKASQEKLQKSIDNAAVTAPASGTVKLKDNSNNQESEPSDVIMSVVADGNFRIKGKINEQNMGSFIPGDAVIIRSRVDEAVYWKGTVSEIGNEPEADNNGIYMYDNGDGSETSSNYAFYIDPEEIEGLMLGQHVLIEPYSGQNSEIEKDGIWLSDDYIMNIDSEEPFVWAANDFGRLEKRIVEIGEKDEANGDSQILSGLNEDDLIAYPDDEYEEGMQTSSKEDEEFDIDNFDDPGQINEDEPYVDNENEDMPIDDAGDVDIPFFDFNNEDINPEEGVDLGENTDEETPDDKEETP